LLLALRLLPDIAVWTLLPALNDPATAVQVNDSTGRLLGLLTARADRAEQLISDVGVAWVILGLPRWPARADTARAWSSVIRSSTLRRRDRPIIRHERRPDPSSHQTPNCAASRRGRRAA
jgi:hypothetical protein